MPTINQLVRKPRKIKGSKSKSPHLQRVTNNLKPPEHDCDKLFTHRPRLGLRLYVVTGDRQRVDAVGQQTKS